MKRRQFMKSVAATTAVPMMPAGLSSTLPVSAVQYAKAVEVANKWAYTTAYYLKIALKVDDAASEAVLKQLQIDGIIGPKGSSGLCLATRISTMAKTSVAKGASEITKVKAPTRSLGDRVVKAAKSDPQEEAPTDPPEDMVCEDQPSEDQTEARADETPKLP